MGIERLQSAGGYSAALYMRLSKDDEGARESASITMQRKMLRGYAREHSICVYDEYVDDGFSGTTFDRPDFQRMIRDIENGNINMVITKDLSRLGRDYILTGQYTEIYFPSKRVRYIAVNDGYDSEGPYTDIAPFKNIINEMYARDISRKIRSALAAGMKEGAFMGAFAPYGYEKDPRDKHHLLVDMETAKIVKEIFQKAADGYLPVQIAADLNSRNIPTPIEYRYIKNTGLLNGDYPKGGKWTSSTITKMLRNIVYLGHMAQGKTTKVSFKSNISAVNEKERWYIVENTHEPVVSREVFQLAERRSRQRSCVKKGQFNNIFSGIAKCADCGRGMSTVGTRRKDRLPDLACGGYKQNGKSECSNHFISYDVLYNTVLSSIRNAIRLTAGERQEVVESTIKRIQKKKNKTDANAEEAVLEKRSSELEKLIERLYEDYASGILGEEHLRRLLQKYGQESRSILQKLKEIEQGKGEKSKEELYQKLDELLCKYTNPDELTQETLFRFIDHIEVEQGTYVEKEQGKIKRQKIRIYFRFADKNEKPVQ